MSRRSEPVVVQGERTSSRSSWSRTAAFPSRAASASAERGSASTGAGAIYRHGCVNGCHLVAGELFVVPKHA